MNKKAMQMSLREFISLVILAFLLIGLWYSRIPLMIWNLILQRPDQATQDKLDRLITEINSLDNGDSRPSRPIPFGVNKEEPFKYTLKSMSQCKKGEDPSSDSCTKKESKLCLLEEGKKKPFCKSIDNGHFKETEELLTDSKGRDIKLEGNVVIAKDDNGFITIEDSIS